MFGEGLGFMQRAFPCAKYIFSLWRDVEAQAASQNSLFGAEEARLDDVREQNEAFLRHADTIGSERARLVYLEDYSPATFTALAHWMGVPCRFTRIPNTNANHAYTVAAMP